MRILHIHTNQIKGTAGNFLGGFLDVSQLIILSASTYPQLTGHFESIIRLTWMSSSCGSTHRGSTDPRRHKPCNATQKDLLAVRLQLWPLEIIIFIIKKVITVAVFLTLNGWKSYTVCYTFNQISNVVLFQIMLTQIVLMMLIIGATLCFSFFSPKCILSMFAILIDVRVRNYDTNS